MYHKIEFCIKYYMRVLKFGGKSLSSIEKTQNICKYIQKIYKNEKKLVVVVSAIGNTTDKLIELANKYGDLKNKNSELAKLLSTGETVSSSLFSIMLNNMGIPAKSLSAYELQINTFGDPLSSRIYCINKKPILDCFENEVVAVVAGFQGINKNGEITTLGRGGSDTTATAIASIFDTNVEIYSDFAGVFAGDPRLFKFKKIKRTNFDIMIKMAKAGAKVLDHRAVTLAQKFNIKVVSKSSSEPHLKGTLVSNIESNIISVSEISGLSKITINFSCSNKLNFIVKNVLFALNDINFYNLIINNDEISFLVESTNKMSVLNILAKKLNLLKK